MKLNEYFGMYKNNVSFDCPDNEIDIAVTFEHDEEYLNDGEYPFLKEFTKKLCENIEIDYLLKDGTPVCKFSDFIEQHKDVLQDFVKENWRDEMQYVLEDDVEFKYEMIREFDNILIGQTGEKTNEKYCKLLDKCLNIKSEEYKAFDKYMEARRTINKYYETFEKQNEEYEVGKRLRKGFEKTSLSPLYGLKPNNYETERNYQESVKIVKEYEKSHSFHETQRTKIIPYEIDKKEKKENIKLNFLFEKFANAGIEVVINKSEFDSILQRREILQKLSEEFKKEKTLYESNAENNNQPGNTIKRLYKDNFNGKKSQVCLNNLNKLNDEIKKNKMQPEQFLKKIQDIMYVSDEKSHTVRHYINDEQYNLRISNHSANAIHAQYRENETSLVIKLSSTLFKNDKNSYLIEYLYNSKNLTSEKEQGIINGLKDWLTKGNYSDKNFDKQFYSPSEEEYLSMINKMKGQNMILNDGKIYGFTCENKIYLNPEIMNSKAAIHEYTHLWDNYTQQTNPELWQKGKNIFKNTHYWEEVKNDPNYADIADNDDLLLSEVHSQICSKMADKVLNKILENDGKLTKDTVIDWDKECWEYIYNSLHVSVNHKMEKNGSLSFADLKDFLAQPMKNLMNGIQITKNIQENNEYEKIKKQKDFLEEQNENFEKSAEKIKIKDGKKLIEKKLTDGINEKQKSEIIKKSGTEAEKIKKEKNLNEKNLNEKTGKKY